MIEAKGLFSITNRGDITFEIPQGYRNIAVLYLIKDMIGIGSVIKQGPRTFRYVVQGKEGLREIIEMLNGNLVLEKRITGPEGLGRFIEAYNKRYSGTIQLITKRETPTWEDG